MITFEQFEGRYFSQVNSIQQMSLMSYFLPSHVVHSLCYCLKSSVTAGISGRKFGTICLCSFPLSVWPSSSLPSPIELTHFLGMDAPLPLSHLPIHYYLIYLFYSFILSSMIISMLIFSVRVH